MKLSIVVPAYNEEATIQEVVRKILAVQLPSAFTREVVVVNDGSTDKTMEVLSRFQQEPMVKVFNLTVNGGKTAALVRGMEESTGDLILIQDADLEYNPDEYPRLLKPIIENEAPVVYGSRFKGTIKGMTLVNRCANVFSNMVFNMLYGTKITDINTCYKLFRREVLKGIKIVSNNFTFETEITVKLVCRGVNIVEVPIDYVARSEKQGKKIRWSTAIEMFCGMIKYRERRS